MRLLSTLDIKCFRGIRNLHIDNLTQVNLIVGDNNCGKTSLLECIQFLKAPKSLANVFTISRIRESMKIFNTNSLYDNFICMFPQNADTLEIQFSGIYNNSKINYLITGDQSRELIDFSELDRFEGRHYEEANGETETDVFNGQLIYTIDEKASTEVIHLNRFSSITGTQLSTNDAINIYYVSPFEHLRGNTIGRIVRNEQYKNLCVSALQLFDPDIEDIMIYRSDVANRPVEYLKHKILGNMPLSTYGDGIKKVLILSNAIINAANGILLIDEIETSIHKKYYDDIFRFIVKASRTFNVQLFITTHSIEAIDGLLGTQDYEMQNDTDAITVVTLKRENHKTYSRTLPGREVFENREAFGFEVRL